MSKKVKFLSSNNKKLHSKFSKKNSKSNASTNPQRIIKGNTDGKNNSFRTKNTIKRLKMYNEKAPNKQKMHERPSESARVEGNRKWFGNVRTIDQRALDKLRIDISKQQQDPTRLFIKNKQIPKSLLQEPLKNNKVRLLQVETYANTFGPNSRRKKVKLIANNMEQLIENVENKQYDQGNDKDINKNNDEIDKLQNRDKRMSAGQSHRIWDQLHKVIDSSDVIVQVLDARDPKGTRSSALQQHLKVNYPHKHLILLLNKADLIPIWVITKWIAILSKQYPTIAYKSSITNPFGKGSLINLFRQFDILHRNKKNISIGFVGYPNVGKSSVINSLKQRSVCKAAPIPGQTKVWQYITLTKRIYLIDCPGTVHSNQGRSDIDSVLKGCIRAEKIDQPTYYIPYIIKNVRRVEIFEKKYGVKYNGVDVEEFIKQVAIKKGKLRKGGQPDLNVTAKLILIDWQRGELPYFVLPEGVVDKHDPKQQITLNQVKEEQFLQMVGGQPNLIIQNDNDLEQK